MQPARFRHHLTSAKSVAVSDSRLIQRDVSLNQAADADSQLEQGQLPVAPPRMKKRQSVPVNNEFVASRGLQLEPMFAREQGQVTQLECIPSSLLTGCDSEQQQDEDGNGESAKIDRHFSASGCETDMNEKRAQQQQHSGSGTISSLFTKLMGKLLAPTLGILPLIHPIFH